MYHVIDLCTDQVVEVTRAFAVRLNRLEASIVKLHSGSVDDEQVLDPCQEASVARLQLNIVIRRLRGLQRLQRDFVDSDLGAGLSRYLRDVADHLDEAQEDATHL